MIMVVEESILVFFFYKSNNIFQERVNVDDKLGLEDLHGKTTNWRWKSSRTKGGWSKEQNISLGTPTSSTRAKRIKSRSSKRLEACHQSFTRLNYRQSI